MITTMSRENARTVSWDIEQALKAVAEKHGLALEYRGFSFDPTGGDMKPKVTFKLKVTADGESHEKKDFERWAHIFGLSTSDFGREFTFQREKYRIVGIAPNRSKRPIVVERVRDGHRLVFVSDIVRLVLGPASTPVVRDGERKIRLGGAQ